MLPSLPQYMIAVTAPVTVLLTCIQAMLPSLPQYMIALLKILLAAAPTSKVS